MHQTVMDQSDLRDEIVRLEAHIETQEAKIESCRKFIMASQVLIGLGAVLLLFLILGTPRSGSWVLIASIASLLGGLVLWGSNLSTAREAKVKHEAAAARRAELIGLIDLQVI